MSVDQKPLPKRKTAGEGAAARSEEAILAAAKALFLEDGYDGANLDNVAKRAGVARQTVYNRFGSKEAMFRAMVRRHWNLFQRPEILISVEQDRLNGDLRTILRRVADIIVEFLDTSEQIAFTRLVIAESRRRPWIGEEFYQLGKRPSLDAFVGELDQLEKMGRIRCPDTNLAAHQFLGLIQEFIIWPKVMAIGAAIADLPSRQRVIDEAIETFVSRYGA